MDIEQTLQQAITHHQAGQLDDAEQLYRSILQREPEHPDTNHNFGLLKMQQGQSDDALALFISELNASPSAISYRVSYIDALICTEQFDVAENILKLGRSTGLEGEAFDQLDILLVYAIEKYQSTFVQTEIDIVTNQVTAKPIKNRTSYWTCKEG
jgi:protein O-GlcNAc transferase